MKTKHEIIVELAETAGVEKQQAADMLDALVKMAIREASDGFTIPGLGKLVKVDRKARTGRNPATGATIQIPAKTVLKFKIAKAAKDAILVLKENNPENAGIGGELLVYRSKTTK